MTLTLNELLLVILALAAVVAVTVFVILALQLKKTAAEAEKALAEYRKLAVGLQSLEKNIDEKLDEVGKTLTAARQAAVQVSGATVWLSSKFVKPASRWWPLIAPVASFLWRKWKQKKEGRHV